MQQQWMGKTKAIPLQHFKQTTNDRKQTELQNNRERIVFSTFIYY